MKLIFGKVVQDIRGCPMIDKVLLKIQRTKIAKFVFIIVDQDIEGYLTIKLYFLGLSVWWPLVSLNLLLTSISRDSKNKKELCLRRNWSEHQCLPNCGLIGSRFILCEGAIWVLTFSCFILTLDHIEDFSFRREVEQESEDYLVMNCMILGLSNRWRYWASNRISSLQYVDIQST